MFQLRSLIRPRFSLRLLLLALTAFAVGFPIWYRWPYEKRVTVCGQALVTTWRRQWGGTQVQHGPQMEWFNGRLIWTATYRNGERVKSEFAN